MKQKVSARDYLAAHLELEARGEWAEGSLLGCLENRFAPDEVRVDATGDVYIRGAGKHHWTRVRGDGLVSLGDWIEDQLPSQALTISVQASEQC